MDDPRSRSHWYDRLPPLVLLVIALVLIGVRAVLEGVAIPVLEVFAAVLIGAAIVLEAKRS